MAGLHLNPYSRKVVPAPVHLISGDTRGDRSEAFSVVPSLDVVLSRHFADTMRAMRISPRNALFALLLASSQVATPQDASKRFKVGEPFPDLVFPSVENGQPNSIAAYRGKKVLLHIFASW